MTDVLHISWKNHTHKKRSQQQQTTSSCYWGPAPKRKREKRSACIPQSLVYISAQTPNPSPPPSPILPVLVWQGAGRTIDPGHKIPGAHREGFFNAVVQQGESQAGSNMIKKKNFVNYFRRAGGGLGLALRGAGRGLRGGGGRPCLCLRGGRGRV